jgi:hypothetical protein
MGDKLLQFGMGADRFLFASYPKLYQQELNPASFDDMEFSSVALPGMDGAVPTNPYSRGRTTSTDISLKFKYAGDESTDWVALKKAIRKPQGQGLTYLFKAMEDGTLAFTLATMTRAFLNPKNDAQQHMFRDGEMSFFCPKARWYSKEGLMFLDNGDALDDSLTLVGPQINRVTVYNGDTVELTNNGDADAGVLMWFESPPGETVENPSLSRMSVDGVSLADQITYNATLNGGDVIILDSRNHQAQLNYAVFAAAGYGAVEALRATWLEVPPGTSEIIVEGTFSNGCILTLDLYDTWY